MHLFFLNFKSTDKGNGVKLTNRTSDNENWPIQVRDITSILKNNNLDKIANKIAERMGNIEYDLIIVNFDLNSESNEYKEQFSNEELIHDIICLTGCPVLCIPKWRKSVPFKNILLPVHFSSNIIKDFEQILPIAKLFNSIIHLLILNSMSGILPRELSKLFNDNKIQFIPKFIDHNNKPDTILAYACIVRADLICNAILHDKYSKPDFMNNTWKNIIDKSEVPLINYLY